MRFTISHPSEPRTRALYGHDHTDLGFWCEVRHRGRLLGAYDGLRVPGGQTSIQGVLDLLVEHGVLGPDDIYQAMAELPHRTAADIPDQDVRRAATVIENLRSAAASEG